MGATRIADWVLRVGLAFAFLYPPFNALSDPNAWIGYFPSFVQGYVSDDLLLQIFGVVEVVVALWILTGWKIILPCIGALAMLLAIVVFNFSELQVLFRDLSIAMMAVALIALHWPKKVGITS